MNFKVPNKVLKHLESRAISHETPIDFVNRAIDETIHRDRIEDGVIFGNLPYCAVIDVVPNIGDMMILITFADGDRRLFNASYFKDNPNFKPISTPSDVACAYVEGCTVAWKDKEEMFFELPPGFLYQHSVSLSALGSAVTQELDRAFDEERNRFYCKSLNETAKEQEDREERKKAITKKAKGHTLTEEEEGLAFSKLRMEDKTEIHFLEDEEIERIKEVVQNGYMLNWTTKTGKSAESGPHFIKQAEYFLFILNTGLRCGESIALKYSDVENRTIAIRRNLTAVKNRDSEGKALVGKHMVIGSTKTDGSADVIPVNTTAITILKQMLEKEPKGYTGYIAHNDDYSHLGETALRKRFSNLLRQAKVESCGIHSLRHTFASKLYEISKGDSKLVSSLVRHSSVSFTEDTYIHLKQKYQQKSIADFSI